MRAGVDAVLELLRATCPGDWKLDASWEGAWIPQDLAPPIVTLVTSIGEYDRVIALEVLKALLTGAMCSAGLEAAAVQMRNTSAVFSSIEKGAKDEASRTVAAAWKRNLDVSDLSARALSSGWASSLSRAAAAVAFRDRPPSSIM